MSEQKSPEIFKKLLQFMALMDSFHDFAQGDRVPGGPIDKRELFRLLNINNKLEIDSNEYFQKGFTNDNSLIDGRTRGLVSRSSGGFEEGITKFLDGNWGNERGTLNDDYQVHNSLYWDKWNLDEQKKQTIADTVLSNGYWSEDNEISYTGNRPKLLIWKKDDIESFNKIIQEQLIKIFGPDRELVFDYSAFNSIITKSLEKQGYIFKVSDSTMWDPATRKDATTGDDGEKIINQKPTNSTRKKYIYNTIYPYDVEPSEFGTENTQFCMNSKIKLLGINRGKGIGEIYPGKLINFQKGRSVSQLGKFIRYQQKRREAMLARKKQKKDDSLETVFLDEEIKSDNFNPDEYNCNALDMKRSGDWGQVAYSKEYGGIFYSGDRMAIMYAIIQKCPYIFTGSILMINGVKYSRMIIDPGIFDPKKFLETGIDDVNIFYKRNIKTLNKIYNCLTKTISNPFNELILNLDRLKEKLKESITINYDIIKGDEEKEIKFEKYLTKFGGKIIKIFEMVNFIEVQRILSNAEYNLAEILSRGISENEDIYRESIKTYYNIDFSKYMIPNKTKILNFFTNICNNLTPNLNYSQDIETIDLLEPDEFKWTKREDRINILSNYNLTLHYNDELLYDKLKNLFFYFNNEDDTDYSLIPYIGDELSFDSAAILLAIIKSDYIELVKLLNNLSSYSVFQLQKQLIARNSELLSDMINDEELGLYTIYKSDSKLIDMIKYEINSSDVSQKVYTEFISYYIHKYLFLPIYIIPFILNKNIRNTNILETIFKVGERRSTVYPKSGKITMVDISLWQYYTKRDFTSCPFFRIGANTDNGEGWFGDYNLDFNTINLLNTSSGVTQNNQLALLYTIVSYIINISHCDIHECTKDIDIDVFYKNFKKTAGDSFTFGINNSTYKLNNSSKSNITKNKKILQRYYNSIINNIDYNDDEIEDDTIIIDALIESRMNIDTEIDISAEIDMIDYSIKTLIDNDTIFESDDYNRIIIPEVSPRSTPDNTNRNKIYHLVINEFLKLLRQAYILKSEHSNISTNEEKFNWIVCDLKIELVKLAIYSIICHMPKRFTEIGSTTLLKSIYDEFEPDNDDNTNYEGDTNTIYPNSQDLIIKLNNIKENFNRIIKKIFNRQMLFIYKNDFIVNPKLSTIFNKIHNKLHNIHFIYNAFHYKNYYRNFKIIKIKEDEKAKIESECKNIEKIDINIFSSDNNIIEILNYCNNDESANILENVQLNEGIRKQHEPDSGPQINRGLPKKGQHISVKWSNKDGSFEFYPGIVKSIARNKKSYIVKYSSDNTETKHGLKEEWIDLDNQEAGAYTLKNLTNMLMNNNYETYINNIKSNIPTNLSSSQVFDKLTEVTKACVKNFYNKSI